MKTDIRKKLVSVVIPVYNVENYLERCVKSVIEQDYHNLEILLVDDGSTDRSGEMCDYFSLMDSRIKVIHKENGGLSSARNTALDILKGDYIFFVDSDDYIFPGIISKLLGACIKYHAEIACCGYKSGKRLYYCNGKIQVFDAITAAKKVLSCNGMDNNAVYKLYKKELFENIRYPLYIYEVIPVTYRIFLKAKQVVSIGRCGYFVEKREGSITRSSFGYNDLFFTEISKQEYEKIKREFPDLKCYAYGFYLNTIIFAREKAESDSGGIKSIEFDKVNNLFHDSYAEIMRNKYVPLRKKGIAFLIKIHMYNAIRKIYRAEK